MNTESTIRSWEITLPDGTHVSDEIEYGYALTLMGVQLVPQRNRRTITLLNGDFEVVAVPENFEENHVALEAICSEWKHAEEIYSRRAQKREELYALYKSWLSEHLHGNALSSLLFASARTSE